MKKILPVLGMICFILPHVSLYGQGSMLKCKHGYAPESVNTDSLLKHTFWRTAENPSFYERFPDSLPPLYRPLYFQLSSDNKMFNSNLMPSSPKVKNPECLWIKGYHLSGAERDSLLISFSYERDCQTGYDPWGPDDPGPPPPLTLEQTYKILCLDPHHLLLSTKNEMTGKQDTLRFYSREKAQEAVHYSRDLVAAHYNAENGHQLIRRDGLLLLKGKPVNGKVMFFYRSPPSARKMSLWKYKDGKKVSMLKRWLPDGEEE